MFKGLIFLVRLLRLPASFFPASWQVPGAISLLIITSTSVGKMLRRKIKPKSFCALDKSKRRMEVISRKLNQGNRKFNYVDLFLLYFYQQLRNSCSLVYLFDFLDIFLNFLHIFSKINHHSRKTAWVSFEASLHCIHCFTVYKQGVCDFGKSCEYSGSQSSL